MKSSSKKLLSFSNNYIPNYPSLVIQKKEVLLKSEEFSIVCVQVAEKPLHNL